MNALQLQKHWRLWSDACKAQGWKTNDDQKRYEQYAIAMGSIATGSTPVSGVQPGVSPGAHPTHPAHPAHPTYSSKDFKTQSQIDALYDHLTQLATHNTSLRAAVRQANPDEGEKKRRIHAIQHRHDEAMWRHIAQDKFGEEDLTQLTLDQLTQLRNTLDARAAARKKRRLEPYDRNAEKRAHVVPSRNGADGSDLDAESDDESSAGFQPAVSQASSLHTADNAPF